jgi:hypothetical protein
VALDPAQVSADPRSRRRRTLHPDQRALPLPGLAGAGAIYAYSFILTNLDVSSPDKAAAAEHWYWHRITVENIFRDGKLGAALRHLPSGYPQVNLAWMWGALLAASMVAWLHQLTSRTAGQDILDGHGVRGGMAMIAVPGRLIRHARHLVLRLPCHPGTACSRRFSPGCAHCPSCPDPHAPEHRLPGPDSPGSPAQTLKKGPHSANPAYPAGAISMPSSGNRAHRYQQDRPG